MEKVILVTDREQEYEGITVVPSLEGVVWDDVEALVFNKSSDNDVNTIRVLSSLNGVVEKVIYISEEITPLYYCIFTGLGGDIYDTENFMDSVETIEFMVDGYKETGLTVESGDKDIETLAKCVTSISTSSLDNIKLLVSNNFWMQSFNASVTQVDNALARAKKINIDVLDLLSEVNLLIGSMESSQNKLSEDIQTLKKFVYEKEKEQGPSKPFIFPTYPVNPTVPKVLYIRVLGSCRYLNSYIIAYQNYLKLAKQYNSKILLCAPSLKMNVERYKSMHRLSPDNIKFVDTKSSKLFLTYEPSIKVLNHFFSDKSTQLYIVVDHMLGDDLLSGRNVEKFFALSSVRDVERFNLRRERTIAPIIGLSEGIIIPHIQKYLNANESTKMTMYFDKCKDSFGKIDKHVLEEGRF